jgi:hypothetical protein
VCGPPTGGVPKVGERYGDLTINSVSISYNDGSSFNMTIECGPVSIAGAAAGQLFMGKKSTVQTQGTIIAQKSGAMFAVSVPVLGTIAAYNMDKYPWDVGDKVDLTIYNVPGSMS